MATSDPVGHLLGALKTLRLRKAQAVLFFLLAHANSAHRNEKVMDLFWQDSDPDKASSSLRQAIRQIRVELGEAAPVRLETSPGSVSLSTPAGFSLKQHIRDWMMADPWDSAGAEQVRLLLSYLTQFEGLSPSFDSWLMIVRTDYFGLLRQALDDRSRRDGTARPDELRQPAEFSVEIEPANEVAVRVLMRLDWQAGRATRAIERYDALYAYLDVEFDQEPETETVELLAAIKLNPVMPVSPPRSSAERPQISMALGMIEIPGVSRENGSFAAVLLADLRLRMGRFREWRILDADGPEAPQIRLTLRPVFGPDRNRLFVEIQRSADGQLVWSEAINEPETDWEEKVRLLLSNIASALSVVVSDRSLSDSGADIYDRWLRAQAILDAWSPETEGQALVMLQEIVEEAPRFGPAHAELAAALNVRHVLMPGTLQSEEVKQRALHHAIVAVTTDPLDTRAHRAVGWCYCHKREFGLAEFHFDQALNLNRDNVLTATSAALGFAFAGNQAKAEALVIEIRRHAEVLEPFHGIYLAVIDYLGGRYAPAAEELARGAGLMPTVGGWHALALWKLGLQDAATRRLRDYLTEIRGQWRGAKPAEDAAILDWFCACFPLRDHGAAQDLSVSMGQMHRAIS